VALGKRPSKSWAGGAEAPLVRVVFAGAGVNTAVCRNQLEISSPSPSGHFGLFLDLAGARQGRLEAARAIFATH
jgi:hypothetical protein